MQELMDWTFHFQDEMISANEVIIKAHKLLEKEKEQIMMAYNDGYVNKAFDKQRNPLEYYNQTYNQNES